MPLLYCKLHERAFDREHNSWVHFPRKDMSPLHDLYTWLRSGQIECPEYEVVEVSCDQCSPPSHEKAE